MEKMLHGLIDHMLNSADCRRRSALSKWLAADDNHIHIAQNCRRCCVRRQNAEAENNSWNYNHFEQVERGTSLTTHPLLRRDHTTKESVSRHLHFQLDNYEQLSTLSGFTSTKTSLYDVLIYVVMVLVMSLTITAMGTEATVRALVYVTLQSTNGSVGAVGPDDDDDDDDHDDNNLHIK
ncbi:hypothetical protein GQX74_004252 [Glossina fuscipes]|nr:hypothetical protein GQX74_004252 [Glossina fuscipes]